MTEAGQVIDFWLRETPPAKRFARDDALDAEIARLFGALHAQLAAGVPDAWRSDSRAMLAAIIVLDQFSRNLFRDDARAFAQDPAALALAKEAVARGLDAHMTPDERQFVYMPFEHAEDVADAERSVALFEALGEAEGIEYAHRHHAVIARFGRYPSRNAALGRESTDEERAFLADHPFGF